MSATAPTSGTKMDSGEEIGAWATIRLGMKYSPELREGLGWTLVLAVIGMYAVLNYSVTRERRDIGLRMALGARPGHIVRLVTTRVMGMVAFGALAGVGGGVLFGGVVRTLLFQIDPTAPAALAGPVVVLAIAAVLAVVPPAIRAVRIDPAQTIKTDA